MALETSEERIRLLKAGMKGKNIEDLYIGMNKLTVVYGNVLRQEGSWQKE